MAPLPVESTGRLFVDYSTCQEVHTAMVRFGTGGNAGDAMAMLDSFWIAITSLMYLGTIQAARVADLGSTVTYPVTWTGAASFGSGAGSHYQTANYVDFVGRSIGGRRVRLATFGLISHADTSNSDYRHQATDSAAVAAGLAVLEASTDTPVAIDGSPAVWQQYADIGVNAYWRNHIR